MTASTFKEDAHPSESEQVVDEEQKRIATYIRERGIALNELIETEKDYVKDLGLVVLGYMAAIHTEAIPLPEDLKAGKDRFVFGNIKPIYEFHRDVFLGELEKCRHKAEQLGPVFQRYTGKLQMYEVYCREKPKSEFIVSTYMNTFEELRQHLGHKLQLPDLLIKPVQRMMMYKLLLTNILEFTERAKLVSETEELKKAVDVMQLLPKKANDMMRIGRLQGFDGRIDDQGELLQQGLLSVSYTEYARRSASLSEIAATATKLREHQVFLFQKLLIISKVIAAKNEFSMPWFNFKSQFPVNWMSLHSDLSNPLKFCIVCSNPRKSGLAWIFKAASFDEREEWLLKIREVLQSQNDLLSALQCPTAFNKAPSPSIDPWPGASSTEADGDPRRLKSDTPTWSPPASLGAGITEETLQGVSPQQEPWLERGARPRITSSTSSSPEIRGTLSKKFFFSTFRLSR